LITNHAKLFKNPAILLSQRPSHPHQRLEHSQIYLTFCIIVSNAFLIAFGTQSNAAYYKDRTGWQSMPEPHQIGYAQGV